MHWPVRDVLLIAAVLLGCYSTAYAGSPSWRQCLSQRRGQVSTPAFSVQSIDVDPLPPLRGQEFSIKLTGTANQAVQASSHVLQTAMLRIWGMRYQQSTLVHVQRK